MMEHEIKIEADMIIHLPEGFELLHVEMFDEEALSSDAAIDSNQLIDKNEQLWTEIRIHSFLTSCLIDKHARDWIKDNVENPGLFMIGKRSEANESRSVK